MASLSIEPRPTVIGLYGLPGSGKSTVLSLLEADPYFENDYLFIEGSEEIGKLLPGGLPAFKQTDAKIFTHIIYLKVDHNDLHRQICNDETRPDREKISPDDLLNWQDLEMMLLQKHCERNDALFDHITGGLTTTVDDVKDWLHNTKRDEKSNSDVVRQSLVAMLSPLPSKLDTVLLIDGDKTLAPEDTGAFFWKQVGPRSSLENSVKDFLNDFFHVYGYSYAAFCKLASEYEHTASMRLFDTMCDSISHQVNIRPEFKDMLRHVASSEKVKAIVVTCGLRLVWQKVLQIAGLSDAVHVIGNGQMDDYIVTPKVKAEVAKVLQYNKFYVYAFGDSGVDLPMLQQADQAVVIVGDEKSRSQSMGNLLKDAIDGKGLQARQILLPSTVQLRLDEDRLPVVKMEDLAVVQALTGRFKHLEATNKAAVNILMTPTRDATNSGHSLREAHRNVGRYLATEYLSAEIGLQQYRTKHVQPGKFADGYRLFHEKKTLIVPLMRGGEPMAFGVSEVFPLAAFLHAKDPQDIQKNHVTDMTHVILVDSVVNTGDSLAEFVKRIRELRPTVGFLAVSGVTHKSAVEKLPGTLAGCGQVTLVSLRTSSNQFKGKGGTDTGARLFNTTEME